MKNKPTIGVTQGNYAVDSPILANYLHAVEAAGGMPQILPSDASGDAVAEQVSASDAIVLIGGPDLSAGSYGAEPHPSMKTLRPQVEAHYLALGRAAILNSRKPVLGICLGMQVINVVCGGTLFRDIPTDVPGAYWHSRPVGDKTLETMHDVQFPDGSAFRELWGREWLCCNSSHHQAVRAIGRGLTVAAQARDGIVEGICGTNATERFLVGVQWHPERLFDKVDGHLLIFQKLVDCARVK